MQQEVSDDVQQEVSDDVQHTDTVYPRLVTAIKTGCVPEVEDILTHQWTQNDRDNQRNGALFETAIKCRHPEVVRCLLRHGVVSHQESPLFSAIADMEILKIVLAEGHSVDVISGVRKTPLQVAITVNPAAISALLAAGCDVTARDGVHGNTPLHTACTQYKEEAILPLIQAGARLNVENWRGETPLHCLLNHACDWTASNFHAKSRQSLARCLIHVGMVVTSAGHKVKVAGGRRGYKIVQVYEQLVKETRRIVASLQHLCRVRVREMCERQQESVQEDGSVLWVIQELELSCYLKEYLLFKRHTFDRSVFARDKVTGQTEQVLF